MTLVEQEAPRAESPQPRPRPQVLRRIRQLLVVVFLVDLLLVTGVSLLAWWVRDWTAGLWRGGPLPGLDFASADPWIVAVWMLWLLGYGAYSSKSFGAGPEEFRVITVASLLAAGTVGAAAYLAQSPVSRGYVMLCFVIGLPVLLAVRYAERKLVHRARVRGRLQHRVVAVGPPSAVDDLSQVLARESYAGYAIVGACVPGGTSEAAEPMSVPSLGGLRDVRAACAEVGADTVLVANGGYSSASDLRWIGWELEGSEIAMVVAPSLLGVAGSRVHMRLVAGLPLVQVEEPQSDSAGGISKRMFDVAVSIGIMLVTLPLWLPTALAIKLHDRGPILFRQVRAGREGQLFGMLKFRSMARDAESRLEEVRHLNESDGPLFKVRDDPRVTPVGRWLRRYSLDELPQLINVLRGHMSLVGPRPPLPSEVATYGSHHHRRLLVRPGMTGLWQVSGRARLSWEDSVRLDLYYVDNWSMVEDLVIIAKTARAVLRTEGAY